MKKILLILGMFIVNGAINSQTITVTPLTAPTNKAYVRVGMTPGFHDSNGKTSYAYESKFDETGNVIGKTTFCVNTNDIALTNGYLELDKMYNSLVTADVKYINYETGESKNVDIFKIVGSDNKLNTSILKQQMVRNQFVAFNGQTFYLINEDLTVAKEYKAKYTYASHTLLEVFKDGCIYYLNCSDNTLILRKIDLNNSTESELKFTPSGGLNLISSNMFSFSFLEEGQYKLSLNNNGTKLFLGFFPGKPIYDPNFGSYVNVAKNVRFIVIDNAKFTVDFDKMIDIPEEYITETREKAQDVGSPVIEDVEFIGDEILVATSCMNNWGVNPVAVYRMNASQKKIELDGMITNKFDAGIARSRGASQMFTIGDKTHLVYFTLMSDDDKYKTINKTYPTFHIVNLTKGGYDHKIFKDEVSSLSKSQINPVNYQTIDKNTILFFASTIGISMYENMNVVKVVFE